MQFKSDNDLIAEAYTEHVIIQEAAPIIAALVRFGVRYGPMLYTMFKEYQAHKQIKDQELKNIFKQIDQMDISDTEKINLIKQSLNIKANVI